MSFSSSYNSVSRPPFLFLSSQLFPVCQTWPPVSFRAWQFPKSSVLNWDMFGKSGFLIKKRWLNIKGFVPGFGFNLEEGLLVSPRRVWTRTLALDSRYPFGALSDKEEPRVSVFFVIRWIKEPAFLNEEIKILAIESERRATVRVGV